MVKGVYNNFQNAKGVSSNDLLTSSLQSLKLKKQLVKTP